LHDPSRIVGRQSVQQIHIRRRCSEVETYAVLERHTEDVAPTRRHRDRHRRDLIQRRPPTAGHLLDPGEVKAQEQRDLAIGVLEVT
jgi:hypothetical protein